MKRKVLIVLFVLFISNLFSQNRPSQQKKYQYSSTPINIMGFNFNSTISQVKKQLQNWDIVWKNLGFDGTVIYVENINWQDMLFEDITFAFDQSNGKIEYIMFTPSKKEPRTKVINTFSKIISNFPYRRKMQEINNYNMQETHEYYNGKDETEFAELTTIGNSIFFTFHFNGSLQRNNHIYP